MVKGDGVNSVCQTDPSDVVKIGHPETDTAYVTNFDNFLADSKKVLSDCIKKLQSEEESAGEKDKLMKEIRMCLARPMNIELKEENFHQILSVAVELNVPEVVSSEILKHKVSPLDQKDETFLVDCFWILANIASGRCKHTWSVITAGAVPFAMEIVQQCPLIKLVTQCIILLGNVLVEDEATLNDIIQGGVCDKTYALFDSVDTHCKGKILGFYHRIIEMKHLDLPEYTLKKIIHQAASVLRCGHPAELLLQVMELINEATNVSSDTDFLIDFFTENGYITKLVSCLSHKDTKVRSLGLVSVGNLLLGTDEQTWAGLKSGMLSHLVAPLCSEEIDTVKHALWILSNITAGEERMMDAMFDFDFLPTVLYYVTCEEPELVLEALWTVANLTRACNQKMRLEYLVQNEELIQGLLVILKRAQKQPKSQQYLHCCKLICECFSDLLHCVNNTCKDQQSSIKQMYSVLGVLDVLKEMTGKELDLGSSLCDDFQNLVEILNETNKTE